MLVKTKHVCPPIPTRELDWAAWIDGEEERGTWHGPTEEAAIEALKETYGIYRHDDFERNLSRAKLVRELLEALEEITEAYASLEDSDYGGRRDPNPSNSNATTIKARLAIAKAKGEA